MFGESAFSGMSVRDVSEAEKFYSETLGLPVENTGMGLRIVFDNGHVVFLYEKNDHIPAAFTVLNFPVTDIDVAVDSLLSKGVILERYDSMPAKQDEKGVLRGKTAGYGPNIAWFKDPSGNILSTLEE